MVRKNSFNMLFDDTQKEILEYVMDDLYPGVNVSKASFVLWLIRDCACDILQLSDEERENISDDMILKIFQHNSEQKQQQIRSLNPEKYDAIIKKFQEENKNE